MAAASNASSVIWASSPSGEGGAITASGRIIAAAVLASRADSPTRKAPVISFSSAQRPFGSSASSQPSRTPRTSVRVAVLNASTTSANSGSRFGR